MSCIINTYDNIVLFLLKKEKKKLIIFYTSPNEKSTLNKLKILIMRKLNVGIFIFKIKKNEKIIMEINCLPKVINKIFSKEKMFRLILKQPDYQY